MLNLRYKTFKGNVNRNVQKTVHIGEGTLLNLLSIYQILDGLHALTHLIFTKTKQESEK